MFMVCDVCFMIFYVFNDLGRKPLRKFSGGPCGKSQTSRNIYISMIFNHFYLFLMNMGAKLPPVAICEQKEKHGSNIVFLKCTEGGGKVELEMYQWGGYSQVEVENIPVH